jgi:uncharacterized protein YjbJ (UPF0337 family)
MTWNQVEGRWKQLKGKAKEQRRKLTDDELAENVQKKAGYANLQTRRKVKEWG